MTIGKNCFLRSNIISPGRKEQKDPGQASLKSRKKSACTVVLLVEMHCSRVTLSLTVDVDGPASMSLSPKQVLSILPIIAWACKEPKYSAAGVRHISAMYLRTALLLQA